jgi:hypothetical protein
MSEKEKKPEVRITRMVVDLDPDNQFGYRPPALRMIVRREGIEERGYVPPKQPRQQSAPSGESDESKGKT